MNRQDAEVIKAYLYDGWSHRKIQVRILGIDAPERCGGYEAMKILHVYGITGEYKYALKGRTFDADAFETSGNIRNYLRVSS
jgi:putative restriction endonuclease